MALKLLIDAVHNNETRIVIAENGRIQDFDFVTSAKKQLKGNIYLAKITRVEPSLQAAFVEYGGDKQGFLPFAEIHPDYYQIPTADREELLKEVAASDVDADNSPVEDAIANVQPVNDINELITVHNAEPAELTASIEAPVVAENNEPKEEISLDDNSESDSTDSQEQEVETLASDEDSVREARRPDAFYRRYKIQEVIKRNQIVLVQVIKEERGNKGVSLTTFISLAGRYCVLMPNSPKAGGISRKIAGGDDRRRLKEISAELKTSLGMSAIIRTAGIDRTRAEIQRDYEYLVKLWEGIREQTLSSSAPALIYEEGDLIKRTIRDLYTTEIEEIVVEGEVGFENAKSFMRNILPSHAPRVKLYRGNVPLFYQYNVEEQLNSMHDQSVKLRSGGYIVLNPTEALISIDVNSGRSTGERNIEETAAKTNLEAAVEIARQLRLRDLAGLVVIDFIDMMDSRNRRAVERALKDALKIDRAKIQIGRISPFGLLEMSRQRLRPSISESNTTPCVHCQGKGLIRSNSSVSLQIVRAAEKEMASSNLSEIRLIVTPAVALDLLNSRRSALSAIELKYEAKIIVLTDDTLPHGNFRIEKVKSPRRDAAILQEPVSIDMSVMNDLPEGAEIVSQELEVSASEEQQRPRRNNRNNRNRNRHRNFDKNEETVSVEQAESNPQNAEAEENKQSRRSKRWRDRRPNQNDAAINNELPQTPPTLEVAPPVVVEVPTLEQQTPQDVKPKKGWWRRIVEA